MDKSLFVSRPPDNELRNVTVFTGFLETGPHMGRPEMYMCSMPWLVCCYVKARLLYLCFLSYIAKYLYETHKKSASARRF